VFLSEKRRHDRALGGYFMLSRPPETLDLLARRLPNPPDTAWRLGNLHCKSPLHIELCSIGPKS